MDSELHEFRTSPIPVCHIYATSIRNQIYVNDFSCVRGYIDAKLALECLFNIAIKRQELL